MATYIKTLKEDNGDITYPQTKGSAVLLDGGSDLETVLATKADASTVNQKITVGDVQSTDIVANAVTTAKIADSNVTAAKLASNSVTTAKIANGAVTSDKLAWSTLTNYHSIRYIGTFNATSTAQTDVPTLTFTCDKAGTYFLAAGGNFQIYGSSSGTYPRIGIYKNNQRLTYAALSINGYTGQQTWSTFTTAQLAVGDVVKVSIHGGAIQLYEGQNLFAIRIG